MGLRKIQFVEGEFYHIYNRGVDKRVIFDDYLDYFRFTVLLYLSNSDNETRVGKYFEQGSSLSELLNIKRTGNKLVDIGAYCLMPNHFHLLIRERTEGGISTFMQKISTAYSKYYNNKNERTGSLFQGKFKAEYVDSDNYLKYLFAYIHLNPVKLIDSKWRENGIKNKKKTKLFLEKYKHSSYLDFTGNIREANKILNIENFPSYFETFEEFVFFIEDWLSFKDN
ncbi:transposase [Patescibacteria group bacterium]|nr:transposase [Patescibacteria group bacterium]